MWRHDSPRLQKILKSYSNETSIVLAQKQTYTSMDQKRELRNKSTHPWSINVWQGRQEWTMEKKQFLQEVVLEKLHRSVQFSHSVVSDSLRPHGLQHIRPPCPSPTPRVHPNSCPLSPVMPSNHLILCRPLLLLPLVFPSIGVFSNESALLIRWPKK